MVRYRLIEQIGIGGMSVIWRAIDDVLEREVAVKVLAPGADAVLRQRLHDEARAVAKLAHPFIAPVFDYGEVVWEANDTVGADGTDGAEGTDGADRTDGGDQTGGVHQTGEAGETGEAVTPFVVMELVRGQSLGQRIGAESMPWRESVIVVAQVAAALAYAHARGIVHRDVTPSNVILTPSGPKVVDFGIAAAIGDHELDANGMLLGTPAYLAPERLNGGAVGTPVDVYGLGLLLYRCLLGRLPWSAATATEMLRAHRYVEPKPLPPLPGVPADVVDICHACISREPATRPPAVEVAFALADAAGIALPIPDAEVTTADNICGDHNIANIELAAAPSSLSRLVGLVQPAVGSSSSGSWSSRPVGLVQVSLAPQRCRLRRCRPRGHPTFLAWWIGALSAVGDRRHGDAAPGRLRDFDADQRLGGSVRPSLGVAAARPGPADAGMLCPLPDQGPDRVAAVRIGGCRQHGGRYPDRRKPSLRLSWRADPRRRR